MDRLDELRAAATACEDDTALAAADAILDAVVEALDRADRGWLAPIAQKAQQYSDKHASEEGRQPVRRQRDEGHLLTSRARTALQLATYREGFDADRAAAILDGFLHAALQRCPGVWKLIPPASIDARRRTLRHEIRVGARDELRRSLIQKDWTKEATAERVVSLYLRVAGVSAKAVSNVLR